MRRLLAATTLSAVACATPPSQEPPPPTPDQAWVASTCAAGAPESSTWTRYRLGDVTVRLPAQYRVSESVPYTLRFRGRFGGLTLTLHRNARYMFDELNRARRFQNWCHANYGGYDTEVIAWREVGSYGLIARWQATWGGQDEGKWLFAQMSASTLEEAQILRDALHTIEAVRSSGGTR